MDEQRKSLERAVPNFFKLGIRFPQNLGGGVRKRLENISSSRATITFREKIDARVNVNPQRSQNAHSLMYICVSQSLIANY